MTELTCSKHSVRICSFGLVPVRQALDFSVSLDTVNKKTVSFRRNDCEL